MKLRRHHLILLAAILLIVLTLIGLALFALRRPAAPPVTTGDVNVPSPAAPDLNLPTPRPPLPEVGLTATAITAAGENALPEGVLLNFAGRADEQSDAVVLPPGIYRLLVSSNATTGTILPVVEEGVCSEIPLELFSSPVIGSLTYRSTGCIVRFGGVDMDGDWNLTVIPVDEDEVLSLPLTLSGEGPFSSAIIVLAEGEYRFELDTESRFTMIGPLIVEGPCLERPLIIAQEAGHYEADYHSGGCQAIITINGATAGWRLTISRTD